MRIGELAERTGVPQRLLRYYQEQDLLHPSRSANGYRDFEEASVSRVIRIRTLLDAGMTTASIRRLLPCFIGEGSDLHAMTDPEMAANLGKELRAIEDKIETLMGQASAIRRYLAQATAEPVHGRT